MIFGLLLLSLLFQYNYKEEKVRYSASGKTVILIVNQILKHPTFDHPSFYYFCSLKFKNYV